MLFSNQLVDANSNCVIDLESTTVFPPRDHIPGKYSSWGK